MALKILLADDSMTAQNMGKKILTDAGYEVVAVSNGAAAVKKIAEINPALCILDIYMPGYTGLEVCEKVKSSSATARMPVLLTVGKMEPYKPEEGARVRADGVIVKPFEASELLRAVHRFSQRAGASQARSATPVPPAAGPTSGTYERTVKLTREQIQEYMDPAVAGWKGNADATAIKPSRLEVPAEAAMVPAFNMEELVATSKTASTTDGMPTFAVQADVEESRNEAVAVALEAPVAESASEEAIHPEAATEEAIGGAMEARAAAVLPGFVDYLLAAELPAAMLDASDEPLFAMQPEAAGHFEVSGPHEPSNGIGLSAQSATVKEGALGIREEVAGSEHIGYDIPMVDPALEVRPAVAIEVTPDPQFETAQEIRVENATEAGLEPTSRASESEGVFTKEDPNLAPMEGLIDAVKPLEGGRFEIPEPGTAQVTPVDSASANNSGESAVAEPENEAHGFAASLSGFFGKKSKKGREMRPVTAVPPVPEKSQIPDFDNAATRGNVTQEISAVLNLLGQTTSSSIVPSDRNLETHEAPKEEVPSVASPVRRVWMAEEVALSDSEATISLENEMRAANAARAEQPVESVAGMATALAVEPESIAAAAEEPVREDKFAPQAATPENSGPRPPSGVSPTQELAAAVAAAFGGALPQEELARAEETQSISEEVRRFALGDAYKPRPNFGGAAIDEPEEKTVSKDKLAAAIARAIDKVKPQLVAEILKELQNLE